MTTKDQPLTEAEAEYLTSLAAAADSYRRILTELAAALESETNLLDNGRRTSGIGSQRLIEAATKQAILNAILDQHFHHAWRGEKAEAWRELVNAAHTGTVRYFHAGSIDD